MNKQKLKLSITTASLLLLCTAESFGASVKGVEDIAAYASDTKDTTFSVYGVGAKTDKNQNSSKGLPRSQSPDWECILKLTPPKQLHTYEFPSKSLGTRLVALELGK